MLQWAVVTFHMAHKFPILTFWSLTEKKNYLAPAIGGKKATYRVEDALYGVNVCRQNKTVIPQVKAKVNVKRLINQISKEGGFGIDEGGNILGVDGESS